MSQAYDRAVTELAWDIPEHYNIGCALADKRIGRGCETALIVVPDTGPETRYSFADLSEQSDRFAARFQDDALAPGCRVAVLLPPSFAAAAVYLGALKAGLVLVPLARSAKAAASIERVRHSQAAAVIAEPDVAQELAPGLASLEPVPLIYVLQPAAAEPMAVPEGGLPDRTRFRPVATRADDPAILAYTSGSEGEPKGVLHAHRIVPGSARTQLLATPKAPGDLIWTHFDWSWLGGLLVPFVAWHSGQTILLHSQASLRPGATVDLLARWGVKHVSIAPTALKMLRQGARSRAFPQLASITVGGEQLDAELREWARKKFGTEVSELYGLTECGGVLGSGHIVPVRLGAIGRPIPGQTVHVISAAGDELGPNELGTFAVEGPHPCLFLGYWRDEAATAAAFCGSKYLTGDVGYRDEDGYFWYSARGDDVISVGGKRTGPGEIEAAFSQIQAVELCAAVGVPDALKGEKVVLWARLRPGWPANRATQEALVEAAAKHLLPYQLPNRIRFVDEIPVTANGKVNRRAVRQAELDESSAAETSQDAKTPLGKRYD